MVNARQEVRLRAWQKGDERDLSRIANNRSVWRNLTDRFPHPYTLEDGIEWIRVSGSKPADERHFAVLLGDRVIGGAGFSRLGDLSRKSAEIGYWLGEPWWGQGIAAIVLAMATEIAFSDFDFERLQAAVLEWNHRSCRVLEKAGYRLEGRLARRGFKDGQVCDMWMYALVRPSDPAA